VTHRISALIPLKGHSGRVPGKNLRDFNGRPLFHVIIETLQRATTVAEIYVDTDSVEIAESAAALDDVIVIERRPELVGDDVSVNRLITAFLDSHHDAHLLQTHATSPLLESNTIDRAVETYFDDPSTTSLFGVTRHQARFWDQELHAINHDPAELIPTQDLEPLFLENSSLYIFGREGFSESDHRITSTARMFDMDPLQAIDIDEESDFALAAVIHRMRATPPNIGG